MFIKKIIFNFTFSKKSMVPAFILKYDYAILTYCLKVGKVLCSSG